VIALKIAQRELTAALKDRLLGFRILMLCLIFGVASIATIGSLRGAIEAGLNSNGQVFLGGDAEIELTYRRASVQEMDWMAQQSLQKSEILDFRSMAVARDNLKRILTQVKAVDTAYPLVGEIALSNGMGLPEALAGQNDLPGAVVAPALLRRLQLKLGDIMRLGEQEFVVMATLEKEPDNFGNFALGPRSIVLAQDLEGSGLLSQGTIFSSKYRLILPNGTDFGKVKAVFETDWATAGGKWKDARNASPGAARAIDRLSTFLVLIGLSGLVVGGIGVSAAVRAFVAKKTGNIAVLKTLGATPGQIFWIYTLQIIAYTVVAVILGVLLGAVAPFLARPFLPESLSAVAVISVYPGALLEAATYGALAAAIFSIWPLAQTEQIRPANLFRGGTPQSWPAARYIMVLVILLGGALWGAVQFSGSIAMTMWLLGGISLALLFLALMAGLFQLILKQAVLGKSLQGHLALRAAVSAISSGTERAGPVVMGIGLGLAVLAAVGQIDGNLRNSMTKSLPDKAPSFFFLDIQSDQLAEFNQRLSDNTEVSRVETAPMLRGLVTQINSKPAAEVGGDHWVLRGDRGISYAATMPENASLTAGQWWPDDYAGSAQISFSAEAAEEIGIGIGDSLTLNVLGRDITATITSLRDVDFSNAGMGFVILLNAGALAGAPHSHIATVYTSEAAEIPILDELGQAFPNVTGIQIREAVLMVSGVVSSIASAASIGAIATLITGFLILIGAASASSGQRAYETAILKTLGATPREILVSFALRSAMVGALAASVALGAGLLGGWAVSSFVFESSFEVIWSNAAFIILGGVGATLITGVLFALGPLSQSAAAELRHRD
jgi:putative ABC transport system permease protein